MDPNFFNVIIYYIYRRLLGSGRNRKEPIYPWFRNRFRKDDNLVVTYQVALLEAFKGEGEKEKSTQQISIESDSLSEATNTLLRRFGNTPNLSHCKLVVFGEEYARKGIKDSLDYLF